MQKSKYPRDLTQKERDIAFNGPNLSLDQDCRMTPDDLTLWIKGAQKCRHLISDKYL